MNILVVSSDASKPVRTIAVDWRHAVLATAVALVSFVLCSVAFNYVALKWAAATEHPWLQKIVLADQRAEASRAQEKLQGHLSAMAVRLGELQAQTERLDALSTRLAKTAGLTAKEIPAADVGRGGAESTLPARPFSAMELGTLIDGLTQKIAVQSDRLNVLEGMLVEDSANRRFLPSLQPVDANWRSSDFGYRIDPFDGMRAFHEGVDFSAQPGTPVVAAAAGKVIRSETHPQYGKLVEVDHGNGLVTRYAHNSELLVNVGDLVVRGQAIATVGSTGRSTGSHLHFEVRLNGVAQNPARFLKTVGESPIS
ncbi:MAG: M23 family metallopeptidase [Proteobacteria bacterium]|nr:M23 family metallopeptidase [Pseudomonadota bacterium]